MNSSNTFRFGVALLVLCAAAAVLNSAEAQDRVIVVVDDDGHHHAHDWNHPRLRFGVSAVGGGFVGPIHGGVGGIAARVGVQFNDVVAVYLQAHGLIGSFLPERRTGTLAGFAFHELMLELTLFDHLQVGAGPSLDFIWGCSEANGWTNTCGRSGPFFGGDLRVAVAVGGHDRARRAGIVFSVDAHPTWVDHDAALMMLFGIGGELY